MTPAEEFAAKKAMSKKGGDCAPRESPHKPLTMLIAMRTKLGLTQREVSKACGLSEAAAGKIENGLAAPSVITAIRIARFFGTTVEAIWGEENPVE